MLGWFDENRGRSYPFLAGTTGQSAPGINPGGLQYLPNTAVVDFSCLMGLESQYVEGVNSVYLYEVARHKNTFLFEFRSDAPGLYGYSLIFTRQVGDPTYACQHAGAVRSPQALVYGSFSSVLTTADEPEGSQHSSSLDDDDCPNLPLWSGYLSTGTLDDLASLLTDGNTLAGGTATRVEPALVRSLVDACVRSVNLANADRTRVTSPPGCLPPLWNQPLGAIFVQAACLTGQLRFEAGYNAVVRQNNQENSLTIGAQVGGGAGQPCGEVPLFKGEQPQRGGALYTGGPQCSEVLRTINGLSGNGILQILPGAGVTVTPDPAHARVIVDVDLHNLNICVVQSAHSEESTHSLQLHDPTGCGPA